MTGRKLLGLNPRPWGVSKTCPSVSLPCLSWTSKEHPSQRHFGKRSFQVSMWNGQKTTFTQLNVGRFCPFILEHWSTLASIIVWTLKGSVDDSQMWMKPDTLGKFQPLPLAERTNDSTEPRKFLKKAHENNWQMKWEGPQWMNSSCYHQFSRPSPMLPSLAVHHSFNIRKSLEGWRVHRVRIFSKVFLAYLRWALCTGGFPHHGLNLSPSREPHSLQFTKTFNKTLVSDEKLFSRLYLL